MCGYYIFDFTGILERRGIGNFDYNTLKNAGTERHPDRESGIYI
jgi:hypothetical protein